MLRGKLVTLLYNMMNGEMPVAKVKEMLRQTNVLMTRKSVYVDEHLMSIAEKLVDDYLS